MSLKTAVGLPTELEINSLTSLEKYIHALINENKLAFIDLQHFASEHNIEIREYPGPSFIMSKQNEPERKLLFVDSQLSCEKKKERIAKGIVHALIHRGDQTRLPIQVSRQMEEKAKIGAKIFLKFFT